MTDPMLDMSVEAMTAPRADGKPRAGGGRPKNGGYLVNGKKVPSVSTILGRFKNADPLIAWAWKQGNEGVPLNQARDKAADVGANVHDAIEASIGGTGRDACMALLSSKAADAEDLTKAQRSFGAFLRWRETSGVVFTDTEVPMVSALHRFGGTVDAIGRIGDDLVVIDWKTGKGVVYPEHVVQTVAYAHLWHETRGELAREIHILRPSKNTGGFNHFSLPLGPEAEKAWRYFLALRDAYELDKPVRDLLG